MAHSPAGRLQDCRRPRLLLSGLALLFACALLGQPSYAQTTADLAVLDVQDGQFPDIAMIVSVTAAGRPVAGLDATSFRVTDDNGSPARVDSVQQAQDNALPVAVVIAIDTSGSMNEPIAPGQPKKIDIARQAAKRLVDQLGPKDQVGIVTFADRASTKQEITTDHAAADQAIDAITAPPGWTALYDAGVTALAMAHNSGLRRSEVVLLTDGKEEGLRGPSSQHTQQDVLDAANQDAIPLLTVGVGSDQDADTLRTFAAVSHGTYNDAQNADAVQQAFDNAAQELRTQYSVKFHTAVPADGKSHNASVSVSLPGGGSATSSASFATRAITPTLTLSSRPPGGQAEGLAGDTLRLDAPREILFQADAQGGAPRIRYTLQGQDPVVQQAPPYQPLSLDPLQMKVGDQSLVVEAIDAAGNMATRTLTLTIPALPPPVQIPEIVQGATLTGSTKVHPQIASKQAAIRQITYTLDRQTPEVFNTPPFEYVITTDGLPRGQHALHVVVTDTNDQTGSYDLPFRIRGTSFNPGLLIVFGGAALIMVFASGFFALRLRRGHLEPALALSVDPSPGPARPPAAPLAAVPEPAGAPAVAVLAIEGGGPAERRRPIFAGQTLLGREIDCDILLEDQRVSRHHARITAANGQLILEDLGSRIGTHYNGARLEPGRTLQVQAGGRVQIGPYTMTLHRA